MMARAPDAEEAEFLRSLIPEKEFADRIGLHRSSLWNLRKRGLPFYRVRGRVWYRVSDFSAFMREHRLVVGGRAG